MALSTDANPTTQPPLPRVFVTGATGFIGRRLVERLLADGHQVTALVRPQPQRRAGLPIGTHRVEGTLENNASSLTRLLADHDILYHLAAKVSFDPRRRSELIQVNAEGTRRLLTAARNAGVRRTVFVSSACTIGLSNSGNDILDEQTPFAPKLTKRNPYLHSKHLAEQAVHKAVDHGQDVTTVNPTTVFGPGDHALNSGTLVRQVATARVMPVPPGGSNVVDVDDVVAGILAAGHRGQAGKRYILGGENLPFAQIIQRIAAVVGRTPRCIPLPGMAKPPMILAAWLMQRATGSALITPQIIADTFAFKYYASALARAELGWRARRSFTDSVTAAWAYYRQENLIAAPAGGCA